MVTCFFGGDTDPRIQFNVASNFIFGLDSSPSGQWHDRCFQPNCPYFSDKWAMFLQVIYLAGEYFLLVCELSTILAE